MPRMCLLYCDIISKKEQFLLQSSSTTPAEASSPSSFHYLPLTSREVAIIQEAVIMTESRCCLRPAVTRASEAQCAAGGAGAHPGVEGHGQGLGGTPLHLCGPYGGGAEGDRLPWGRGRRGAAICHSLIMPPYVEGKGICHATWKPLCLEP